MDTLLRLIVLALCCGVIATFVRIGIWTITPWWHSVMKIDRDFAVQIAPVGLIEDGKIKNVEARAIALTLNHELDQIFATLRRKLADEYSALNDLGFQLASVAGAKAKRFEPLSSKEVNFTAQFFSIDVAGFLNAMHGILDRTDKVKVMIEAGKNQFRLFLQIESVSAGHSHKVAEVEEDLSKVVKLAACAVARHYLDDDDVLNGLSPEELCVFVERLKKYHEFIESSAERKRIDPLHLNEFVQQFEAPPLTENTSPAVHLILASLYRLQRKNDQALQSLEIAARRAPDHKFVATNLAEWKKEKANRIDSASADLTANVNEELLDKIASQSALEMISFSEMTKHLTKIPARKEVRVAVFGTGYTPPVGLNAPKIEPTRTFLNNRISDENGKDEGGYGSLVTNLLAALTRHENVILRHYKIFDGNAGAATFDIANALDYAREQNTNLYIITFGSPVRSEIIADAIEEITNAGGVVVAVAGNSSDGMVFPAALENVIAIGATNRSGGIAPFSHQGDQVVSFAPGVDIKSSLDGQTLVEREGTDFSTVIMGAIVASAMYINPDLSSAEVKAALKSASKQRVVDGPPMIDALEFITAVRKL